MPASRVVNMPVMQPGTLVAGRYRIVRHLGSGAMGSVHLAEDRVLGRQVAIKSVRADAESEYGRRVQREARLGAALGHPNLVTVYDILVEGGALLLIMELVAGETLDEVLARGPLAAERALAILRPVGEALDHVHSHGVVHRDVKPANILLDERDRVKLADLGIATSDEATRITRTGGVLGTAAYMAPEQFDPEPVTAAADIHSLATVAFEMLTGRRAYAGTTFFEVMARVRAGEPPDAREARPQLPAAAADALRRGMAQRPSERPITAGALVDELQAAFRRAERRASSRPPVTEVLSPARRPRPDPRAPSTPATPRPATTSRSRRLAALAAVLAAVSGLAVVLATGGGTERSASTGGGAGTGTPGTPTDAAPGRAATTAPPATAPPPASARPTSPAGAVRAFYERAADGDLDAAWALAGPGLRAQLGPRATFDGTFRTLRDIRFERLDVTDATSSSAAVAVATTATHTDRVDRCTGFVDTARAPTGGWRVDRVRVDCRRG